MYTSAIQEKARNVLRYFINPDIEIISNFRFIFKQINLLLKNIVEKGSERERIVKRI